MIVVFRDPQNGESIELSDAVVELLSSFRQKGRRDVERGGLLFANPSYTDHVVIDSATRPHPHDRATRTSLSLDHDRCIAEIGSANDGGRWFVGYWHTHPETQAQISGADMQAFSDNLRAGGHELSALLAVIVGNNPGPVRLSGYMIKDGLVTGMASSLTDTRT
jgi:integrative and conjugative element protein (TIGR02256 family)